MQIILFEPQIPPNTGNIARLCAGTNTELHLIKPLGFSLADRYLKRAGLDYWKHVNLKIWDNFADYLEHTGKNKRIIGTSARAGTALHKFEFQRDDALLFGPETRGLPAEILNCLDHTIRIPIINNIRSLNLSTATGIVLYQAFICTGMLDEFENTSAT